MPYGDRHEYQEVLTPEENKDTVPSVLSVPEEDKEDGEEDAFGSATNLQRPPGINSCVGGGQHDGDVVGVELSRCNQAPLARPHHVASVLTAEPTGEDSRGDPGCGAPLQGVPLAEEVASRDLWSRCAFSRPAPLVQDAMLCRPADGGVDSDSCRRGSHGFGEAPRQRQIVFKDAFPTDSIVRRKGRRTAREETLAEEGFTLEGIKGLREKKDLDQEQHVDGCGGDLGFLEEKPLLNALAVPWGSRIGSSL